MTKYILHGGFDSGAGSEDNSDFYKEIITDAPNNARILLVPFAKDENEARIAKSILKVSRELDNAKGSNNIAIYIANQQHFIDQAKDSDILYFHGGVSLKLLQVLQQYPDLEKVVQGKVIAGESAGANVWAKFFYSPKADKVSGGLGFLPIKLIPHFREEYAHKLDHVGSDLELVALPEYQYRVFEI